MPRGAKAQSRDASGRWIDYIDGQFVPLVPAIAGSVPSIEQPSATNAAANANEMHRSQAAPAEEEVQVSAGSNGSTGNTGGSDRDVVKGQDLRGLPNMLVRTTGVVTEVFVEVQPPYWRFVRTGGQAGAPWLEVHDGVVYRRAVDGVFHAIGIAHTNWRVSQQTVHRQLPPQQVGTTSDASVPLPLVPTTAAPANTVPPNVPSAADPQQQQHQQHQHQQQQQSPPASAAARDL